MKRQKITTKVNSQKILSEIKKKKTMMIKINDVIEKALFRSMIIKDLISDDLKLLTSSKKTRKRMKKNRTLTYDISSFATIVRRTYVVLTHDMRRNDIDVFNQQKIINHIIKQNLNLHKKMNIVKIA